MEKYGWKSFGFGVGVAASAAMLFELWLGKVAFRRSLSEEKSPLAFVEHYHIGLSSLIASRSIGGRPFLDGLGSVLVASEVFQPNPFGYGKSEAEVRGNIALGVPLLGLLLITLGK